MNDTHALHHEDRRLVARLLEDGDEAAFRDLYARHAPALYALVRRYLHGTSVDPEDVLQEAWLRAVRALPRFRWASALRTWLSGIALNQAREALRRLGRNREDLRSDPAFGVGRSDDPGLGMDLNTAIDALPDGYRTVLLLHDWQGYTHAEIGDTLGISPGTSRSQLHHARRAVRETLGERPRKA